MADSTWLTTAVVRKHTGQRSSGASEEESLAMAANAAAEYVEELHPELFDDAVPPVFTPTATILLGAAMLANRWYARRSSPLGVAGYAELGSAGILRYDPDIARLLGIGSEGGRFVFGAPTPPVVDEVLP